MLLLLQLLLLLLSFILLGCESEEDAAQWMSALERLLKEMRYLSLVQRSTVVSRAASEEQMYEPRLSGK